MKDCKCLKAVFMRRDPYTPFSIGYSWVTDYEHRYFRIIR